MKKIFIYILIIFFYAIIYMILAEEFSLVNFAVGILICTCAILFSNKYLLSNKYHTLFPFRVVKFVLYFFYLIIKIMLSGVSAAILTITGKVKLEYKNFSSELDDDFGLNLLANSITMTPGTVTINRKNNNLYIMQLCPLDKEFDMKDILAFEKRIKKLIVSKKG